MSAHRRADPRHDRGARGRASERWYVEPDTEEIPIDGGAPLDILDTSYGPTAPPRPPRRSWALILGCVLLLVGVAAAGWYALSTGALSGPTTPPAAPASAAAPPGDTAPPTVAVQSAPDGQLGPGRWTVGGGTGQAPPGLYQSAGPTIAGIPCYAEVFRRGPSDTAVGASVARVSTSSGATRLRVPDVTGTVITTGCRPWRRA